MTPDPSIGYIFYFFYFFFIYLFIFSSVDVAVEAAKLLGLGRRHLLVGDAPAAVQALQEACGLL